MSNQTPNQEPEPIFLLSTNNYTTHLNDRPIAEGGNKHHCMNQGEIQYAEVSELKKKFSYLVSTIVEPPIEKKKTKATNIPKFLLKLFIQNIPPNLHPSHLLRLKTFIKNLSHSKTRFDIAELLGKSSDSSINSQNKINRQVLRKILQKKHIRNKRLYLMFCKKVIFRLDHPELIDRLQV